MCANQNRSTSNRINGDGVDSVEGMLRRFRRNVNAFAEFKKYASFGTLLFSLFNFRIGAENEYIIWLVSYFIWCSHFEGVNGDQQKSSNDVNKTNSVEFNDNGFINPITGAPIINQDAIDTEFLDANNFLPSIFDDGEFLDTTADVSPNSVKHATCGKLSVKWVLYYCELDVNCVNEIIKLIRLCVQEWPVLMV